MATVLIVEDDPSLLTVYKTELEARGHTVLEAKDGEAGLEAARNDSPDLILLDIMMPKKTGMEVLQELEGDDSIKGIPVLILTNFGQQENVKQAIELGAKDFLLKYSVTPAEIGDKIEQVLGL